MYRLVGDHVGIVDIESVEVLNNFQVDGNVDASGHERHWTLETPA